MGSEMCIRDSHTTTAAALPTPTSPVSQPGYVIYSVNAQNLLHYITVTCCTCCTLQVKCKMPLFTCHVWQDSAYTVYVRAVHVHVYMHILRAVRGVRLCGVACVRRDLATHLTEDKSCNAFGRTPQTAGQRAGAAWHVKRGEAM